MPILLDCSTPLMHLKWPEFSWIIGQKLHGNPQSMVSYRDKIFVSQFWTKLFSLLGAELSLSTTYHPQTDGQSERVNQVMEMYIRCMSHLEPKRWNSWLSVVEWWYNITYHNAIQISPFEALYGIKFPQLALGLYMQANVAIVGDYVKEREWIHSCSRI